MHIFSRVTNLQLVFCNQSLIPSITIICYDFFIHSTEFFGRNWIVCLNRSLFSAMIFMPTSSYQASCSFFPAMVTKPTWVIGLDRMTDEWIQWQISDPSNGSIIFSIFKCIKSPFQATEVHVELKMMDSHFKLKYWSQAHDSMYVLLKVLFLRLQTHVSFTLLVQRLNEFLPESSSNAISAEFKCLVYAWMLLNTHIT